MPTQAATQPLTLLGGWMDIIRSWQPVFCQQRSWLRAARQALGGLLVLGRATLSRILWTNGREQQAWSGEYLLHSRAVWNPQALFAPLLQQALAFCPARLVGVAVDRESLLSSLIKKVVRGDRFLRPEKNTFALRPEAR